MTEHEAIDLALKVYHKHILPAGAYDEREGAIIQAMADLYKAGYELVPRFRPGLSVGDIERMKEEGVIY